MFCFVMSSVMLHQTILFCIEPTSKNFTLYEKKTMCYVAFRYKQFNNVYNNVMLHCEQQNVSYGVVTLHYEQRYVTCSEERYVTLNNAYSRTNANRFIYYIQSQRIKKNIPEFCKSVVNFWFCYDISWKKKDYSTYSNFCQNVSLCVFSILHYKCNASVI